MRYFSVTEVIAVDEDAALTWWNVPRLRYHGKVVHAIARPIDEYEAVARVDPRLLHHRTEPRAHDPAAADSSTD